MSTGNHETTDGAGAHAPLDLLPLWTCCRSRPASASDLLCIAEVQRSVRPVGYPDPMGAPDLAFDALADPVRREILGVLAKREECSAGEVSEAIHRVGRTAVSSHLRVLRTAGLIAERRTGRFRYYSVDSTGPAQDVIQLLHELFRV